MTVTSLEERVTSLPRISGKCRIDGRSCLEKTVAGTDNVAKDLKAQVCIIISPGGGRVQEKRVRRRSEGRRGKAKSGMQGTREESTCER